jgi:aldehyde dehydrogenase (NAD(P)+)
MTTSTFNPSTADTIEEGLATVTAHKQRWARLPIFDKINYLREIRDLVIENAEDWTTTGAQFKGFDADHQFIGAEEWLGGPYPTTAWITEAIRTLTAIRTDEDPLAGMPVHTRDDGQVVLRAMPGSIYDRLLLSGFELDIWMEPGVTEDRMRETVGSFYAEIDPPGRVSLVLGAGNVSAIPVLDVLYLMFVHGDVVVLKLNPIAEAYGPVFEAIFAPLIRDGYLRIVHGGAEVGQALVRSDLVETVHITGSARTFDAIVWGTGEAAERRKASGEPLLTKPISSELGGVGPTIVVPGTWSKADIEFQAEHIATQKLHSSGHTCVASQVLVLPASWPQREEFVAAVKQALARTAYRVPFYPRTDEKLNRFLADNPEAGILAGHQRVALLEDVDPESNHPAFTEEFFGPVYLTTNLPGDTVEEYLANAVTFANDTLAGNLGANLIVDPDAAKKHKAALDSAVADLRYGCVGVNAWAGVVFLMARACWGAFGGNTVDDIQSGSGVVHNALMLAHPQKNVLWAPFRTFPRSVWHGERTMAVKPPWFLNNATSLGTARRFTHFAADPGPGQLPGLFASALLG